MIVIRVMLLGRRDQIIRLPKTNLLLFLFLDNKKAGPLDKLGKESSTKCLKKRGDGENDFFFSDRESSRSVAQTLHEAFLKLKSNTVSRITLTCVKKNISGNTWFYPFFS